MTSEKYCLSIRMICLSDISLHVCGPQLDQFYNFVQMTSEYYNKLHFYVIFVSAAEVRRLMLECSSLSSQD